ncbi:hypothetical protein TNCV_1677751 [Trichonephila clavipes]|nr:hypothetical protein TNCV_1677751 [Trichonephila clavipes]
MQNLGGRGRLEVKVTNSWLECHELEPSTAEDPPCRDSRCWLNLSRLKPPPVGVVWKLEEEVQLSTQFGIFGQETKMTHEQAPPLRTSKPSQRVSLDRFNVHQTLYMADLQRHQDSNSRHTIHEFVTITTRPLRPLTDLIGVSE